MEVEELANRNIVRYHHRFPTSRTTPTRLPSRKNSPSINAQNNLHITIIIIITIKTTLTTLTIIIIINLINHHQVTMAINQQSDRTTSIAIAIAITVI